MSRTYTFNQTSAIVCLFSACLWGITAYGGTGGLGELSILLSIIVGWIIIFLYIKLIKPAFLIGIAFGIYGIIAVTGYTIFIDLIPWYAFTRGMFDISFILLYFLSIAHIYFAYKSWRELG
ncbi:hypothetical protein KAX75_03095 [candidate division WOR-3 bacterium]|nr:hypothetical protein [candidate division WOR-3 bacterium]